MLKAINTKILLAILAALTAIGGALSYQRHEAAKAAAAAAILQQQQRDAEKRKAVDEAFRQRVEQDRKRHSSAAAHEGKTWRTYIP